jgi:hypothetical protein
MSLPDSTTQRHAAAIPGIKFSHLVYVMKSIKQQGKGPIFLLLEAGAILFVDRIVNH